jgi:hypothetical protein
MEGRAVAFNHIGTFIVAVSSYLDPGTNLSYSIPSDRPDSCVVYQILSVRFRLRKKSTTKFSLDILRVITRYTIMKYSSTYFINELQILESAKRRVKEFVGK